MTEAEFVAFVKDQCRYYGITFAVPNVVQVRTMDGFASGYFDDTNKVLKVARKNPRFLSILAHEYCHLTQWAERAPVWVDSEPAYVAWAKWSKGEDIEDINHHIAVMRDLELDNEKRTAALIKKLKLDIDINTYIKEANAYIMFYNYMMETGKWAKKGRSPYQVQRLVDAMPSKFSLNYQKLPERLRRIYVEEGI